MSLGLPDGKYTFVTIYIYIFLVAAAICHVYHSADTFILTYTSVGGSVFETHRGLFRDKQPEYGCFDVIDSKDSAFPHVKTVMFNNMAPSDSTIIYGELYPILVIMYTQLQRLRFSHHLILPVRVGSEYW